MRASRPISLFACVLATLVASACGKSTSTGGGPQTGNTAARVDPDKPGGDTPNSGNLIAKDASILKARYNITAKALGIPACNGEIELRIKADLQPAEGAARAQIFEGAGIVDCGLMKIDLKEVLGGLTDGPPPPNVKDPVVVKNDVLALKALGYGVYDPPRPLFPSFLAASAKNLKKLDVSVDTKLNDTQAKKSASGNVHLRTLEFNGTHEPPNMKGFSFKRILHFEVVHDGFEGVDKVANFLFDKLEFKINLAPVAIPYFEFQGPISDLLNSKPPGGGDSPLGGLGDILKDDAKNGSAKPGGGGILGGIVGVAKLLTKIIDVHITADLISQEGLDRDAVANPDSDGPKIGGREEN